MSPASITRVAFSARWSACRVFSLARCRQVEDEREPGEGRREARGEERRGHEQPVARPERDGGRGDQVSRVEPDEEADGRARTERRRAGISLTSLTRGLSSPSRPSSAAWRAESRPREVAEGEERPALGGHRGAQLEDAEHVVEALGAAEVPDQEHRAQDHGDEHRVAAGANERLVLVAEELGDGREQVHPCPDTPDPEVDRDLPRPVGVLYWRDAVVILVLPLGSVSGWCEVSGFPLLCCT